MSENCCGENAAFYGHHHTEECKRASSERNKKGLLDNINRSIRSANIYDEWRKKVFVRDDYTCQECSKRGGYLQAHHIKELSKLIEEYPNIEEEFIKDSYKLIRNEYFWNIENGLTLCVECHAKFHEDIKNLILNSL